MYGLLKNPVFAIGDNLCKISRLLVGLSNVTNGMPGCNALPVSNYCLQAVNDDKNVLANEKSDERDTLYLRLEIEVRGHDPAVLKSYEWFACRAAKELDINISKTWVPRYHLMRRDALKSVHVHKKHIVQYEFRTYFRVIELKHLTGSTADTYLEYIQRNLPEGVAMKVTKKALARLPEHIQRSQEVP